MSPLVLTAFFLFGLTLKSARLYGLARELTLSTLRLSRLCWLAFFFFLASRCQLCLHQLRTFKKEGKMPREFVRVRIKKHRELVIPLFLTEPKTGRTRYPTCTNTILGPSLLCGQPVRQMVHGNDPLQSPAHSNGQAALLAHTHPSSQSLDPSDQDPPALAPCSTNGMSGGAGRSVFWTARPLP